jgi:perosamine synthetase
MEIHVPSMTPSISDLEVDFVADAVKSGWGSQRSAYLEALSNELVDLTKLAYCTPVSHGTSGLQLALHALGVGPGDEVIVPDLTWVASASTIGHLGAKPVFVDIDETMCINASHLRSVINPKTKAMVIVDLVGSAPKWDEIRDISDEMQIPVVEDATESIGSKYKMKAIGSLGTLSVLKN